MLVYADLLRVGSLLLRRRWCVRREAWHVTLSYTCRVSGVALD
jgi:hypothetical protein